jgi:hypothetical protein
MSQHENDPPVAIVVPYSSCRWWPNLPTCDQVTGLERRIAMKFQDLFVPRWQHSNPEVRKAAVERLRDIKLLKQIAEIDEHQSVREAALSQLNQLTDSQVQVTE